MALPELRIYSMMFVKLELYHALYASHQLNEMMLSGTVLAATTSTIYSAYSSGPVMEPPHSQFLCHHSLKLQQ
jgi:hypothetical protein